MIPIVTKQCGVDIDDFGFQIKELSVKSIIETINICSQLDKQKFYLMSLKAFNSINKRYTIENYKRAMYKHIVKIIGKQNE